MRHTLTALILASLTLAVLNCAGDEDPVEPDSVVPGVLTLFVYSPFGEEGAALLDIEGGAVTAVTADAEAAVYMVPDGTRLRIAIVRAVAGDLKVQVAVSDTSAALNPRLLQVAGPNNTLRSSLSSYGIEVHR